MWNQDLWGFFVCCHVWGHIKLTPCKMCDKWHPSSYVSVWLYGWCICVALRLCNAMVLTSRQHWIYEICKCVADLLWFNCQCWSHVCMYVMWWHTVTTVSMICYHFTCSCATFVHLNCWCCYCFSLHIHCINFLLGLLSDIFSVIQRAKTNNPVIWNLLYRHSWKDIRIELLDIKQSALLNCFWKCLICKRLIFINIACLTTFDANSSYM